MRNIARMMFITFITFCRYFIVSVWVVAALVASPFLVYRKMVIVKVSRMIFFTKQLHIPTI